ncbi:MAG: hypothetical protein ABH878_07635 [bacterium]
MTVHRSATFTILIGLTICLSSAVQAGSNAGMAGAFLRMGLGARALGMGDVGVAIPGDGFGIFYNPAALPHLQHKTFMASYSYLSLERRYHFIGFAAPLHPPAGQAGEQLQAGLGIGWINAGPGTLEGRDSDGNPAGTFENSENAFYVSFGLRITNQVAIGISPKVLYNTFPDISGGESLYSTRLGFDAGLLINPWRTLYLGVQARHINAQYRWDTSTLWGDEGTVQTDKFPRIYRIGASYNLPFGLLLAGEYETSDQEAQELHWGGEYTLAASDQFRILTRAGYDDGDYALGLGFGFSYWSLTGQLDYVYQIQEIPPFDSQVISLSVQF